MRALAALSALLLLAGCDGRSDQPRIPRAVTLDGARWSLDLPQGAAIAEHTAAGAVSIDHRPGGRQPKRMRLFPAEPADAARLLPEQRVFTNGARIAYRLIPHEGLVGSGGEELRLEGLLVIAGRSIAVRCLIQAEAPPLRRAAWCLDDLATLRPAP